MSKNGQQSIDEFAQPQIGPTSEAGTFGLAILNYLVTFAMVAFATVLAIGAESKIPVPNLSLLFVIPVVVAGLSFGLGPSLFAAVMGALSFNFFLTEPRYSLMVDDPANIWAIGLLFVVGLIVSSVSFTFHRRAAEAVDLHRQAMVISNLSRDIAQTDSARAAVLLTSSALANLCQLPTAVVLIENGEIVHVDGPLTLLDAEREAARACANTGKPVRAGIYPNDSSRFDFWPVRSGNATIAVLGAAADPGDRPASLASNLETVANLFGLAVAKFRA